MKNLYQKLILKIHHFLYRDVYMNIPNEFREFPINVSISLWIKSNELKLEKLEKEKTKFNNEILRKLTDFENDVKNLKTNIGKNSYNIDQQNIQINRLKNLKK